jgi:macrodomain Ter protein organizer (MatP/YcbG family)
MDNGKQKISINLDSELWKKLRIKSLEEGKTATEIVEKMVSDYVKKK